MPLLKHSCEVCDSVFTITFDEVECEDTPHYCPFCGEYTLDDSDYDIDYDDES